MENFIGRENEINMLRDAFASQEAALVAVYGRRRVGKTYLVRTVFEKELVFEFTGANRTQLATQLDNFHASLLAAFKVNIGFQPAVPENWSQAFRLLIHFLEEKGMEQKQVLFLDEFPWLDQKKSGFLSAFDHFWNSWASKQRHLVVVLCGSAASWMIRNVVRNKGGLHNRITHRIRLVPFNLHETALFLKSKRIQLSPYDLLQAYMVTGGVPHYLKHFLAGESITQTIDRLCFTKDGALRNEFKDLYPALFGKADKHIAVIRSLAGKASGMTRNEIIASCQFKSGGTLSKVLEELEESNFISAYPQFGKSVKEAVFKLTDEYSLFYLKFVENSKAKGAGAWQSYANEQAWLSWRGFAFENICLKHIAQIKKALGISGVYTEESVWRYLSKGSETGAQIDLLIDRQDNCVNLFEIKFHKSEWAMDKNDAAQLEVKREVFREKTGTKKTVFISLLTTYGAKRNEYFLQTVQNQLTMDVLFERV
ncbi:MAG: AAA family ATPase [Haliscomenobacter sp.]|nr:AAA family ATPase [Haliscomenobacter sp.]MBK8879647.1 AAA family ATPase [Haliscomenobacter sp.]